jgi:hypothetical protein
VKDDGRVKEMTLIEGFRARHLSLA